MKQIEDNFDTQSLQIEQCKQWIKQRFISELETEGLPLDWSIAWACALTEMGLDMSERAMSRIRQIPDLSDTTGRLEA